MGINVEQMWLFGSFAKGTFHLGSDIDLIVVSPDWAQYSRQNRLETLGIAAARILAPIDAVGFTPEEIRTHQLSAFWEQVLSTEAVPVAW